MGRAALAPVAALLGGITFESCSDGKSNPARSMIGMEKPIVISTWNFGMEANEEAWKVLGSGGSALDAVEQGVRQTEADAENGTVGLGGLPDRDGRVTLDACIMDHEGNAGSVCALEDILHPVSVARRVMEKTPHVMLVGEGAQAFALSEGFEKQNLLTEKAKKSWQEWLVKAQYAPKINVELHDTIGMLALDRTGNIAGACTTSGLAFKMRGRVGDSPIIGAGLFVDNEVGAAAATGLGEVVLKTLGSFLVVEMMRSGKSPYEACMEAVKRIAAKNKHIENFQVGFIAINKEGETGAFSIHPGFNYAVRNEKVNQVFDAESLV